MKTKQWLTCAAAALMMTSLFVGCGTQSDSSGAGNGKLPIKSVSLPEKLDGNEIRILGYAGWEGEQEEIRKILKDAYNVDVKYTVLTNWQDNENKIATELAAGNAFDLVITGKSLFDNGLVQPIDQYFDLEDPIFKNMNNAIETMRMKDGKLYGITSTTYPQVIVYNKTLFENNGLEDPLECYNNGTWTFDKFKEACSVLASQEGANGKKKYAFSSWDPSNFLTANGTYYVKNVDGKVTLNLDDPKLTESLKYFRDLGFTQKSFTTWQGWSFSDFESGQLAMIMDRFGNKTASTDFKFDWDFVPFPQGPSGSKDQTPGTVGFYGVGKGAKNPSGGAAYIYLFCRQDYLKRGEYLRGYFTEEQAKRYEELQNKVLPVPPLDGIKNPDKLMYDILAGGDVAAKVEEVRPVWQAAINDYEKGLNKKNTK